jgi:NMD protein affecting ribosome stability and mRNA decay
MNIKQIRSVCMYCGKVTKKNEVEPPLISHGICDQCLEERFPSSQYPEQEENHGPNQLV